MKNTFAYFKNIDNYTSEYNSRNNAESHIDNQTICFIEDGGKIYTHGKQFGGGSGSDTTTIGGETINVITEGGVKVIDPTNLPKAGVNKLGILGLKLGGGVKIDSNTMIYVDPAETLQNIKQYISEYPSTEMPMTPASKTKLGGVIVGNGIDVASNGKISVNVQEVKNMFTNAGITFGGASKLSDLEDVTGTPVSGQVLKWNGSKWAPATDETGEGGSGAPANYVIGWTVSGENVTFADNKNNTVTINTSGSSSSIDDFGVNPISNDTFDGPMFELEIMEGANAHTAVLPTIISSDNSVTINQSTSNGLYAIDLSIPAGSRPGNDPMITAARYDVLGGLKAFDANETLSLGASVAGELYYSQDAYGRTDDSVVLPLRIDNSKDFGYIEIPTSLFESGAEGTVVIANPDGDATSTLNKIQIGNTKYSISGGNGGSGIENAFSRVIVGNTNIDASGSDSFSLVAGTNITITPDASDKTITINATGGGETTYIENPYNDDWKDDALNRITAAENSLREMHTWAEGEIDDVAADALQKYIELRGKIGGNQYYDETTNTWKSITYDGTGDGVDYSEIVQRMNLISATVDSIEQTENNHYTNLNSRLNLATTDIDGLKTSVASLGTSYSELSEDGDALSWLGSWYHSLTNKDKTIGEMFSDVQTAQETATAGLRTEINTLDGKVTTAQTTLASMVEDVNGLKSNSAGYLTQATLDGAVATMFANSSNGAAGSGKDKVTAYIEARVGDMVSEAAQGQGALSELKLSADLITLDGNTTVAGALTADYIISKVNGSQYLWVGENGIESDQFTVLHSMGIGFTDTYSSNQWASAVESWDKAKLQYNRLCLRPTLDDDTNTTSGITMMAGINDISRVLIAEHGRGRIYMDGSGIDVIEDTNSSVKDFAGGAVSGIRTSISPNSVDIWGSSGHVFLNADEDSWFTSDVHAPAFPTSSDIRYKNIIDDIHIDIADIAAAPKFTYTNKGDNQEKVYAGTSAQYWDTVVPETVSRDKEGHLSLSYGNAALISAISIAEEVVALKNEIAELKQQIAELKSNN